jgi:hypothetical protein
MIGAVWSATLTLALAQPAATKHLLDDTPRPKLLVKSPAYFLHALPPAQGPLPRWQRHVPLSGITRTISDGLVLLHTTVATGEMKILAAGTTTVIDYQRNSGPEVTYTRIAGVAVDKERLYVLQWSGNFSGTYQLLVFRLYKGQRIYSRELKGDGVPTREPKETADKGPLRLLRAGVACFGTRFEFQGSKLLKQVSEKKR